MVSHWQNAFAVTAPERGLFSVSIHDDYHLYRIIEAEVPEGTSEVIWDGCAYNLEKLNTQYYTFDFSLSGESGRIYTFSFQSPVVDNAQFLQFALPSSGTVYLSAPDDWFLEAKAILNGTLLLDFYPVNSDKPSLTVQKTLHQGRVEHFSFSKLTGKNVLTPGLYSVYAYEISRPDERSFFSLRISDDMPPETAINPTGNIMPDEFWTDAEIWDLMMQPSVVVDIDYLDHQSIYPEPEYSKQTLGTIHGQTQCLCVLEIQDDWAKIGAWEHEDGGYVEGWVPVPKLKTVYPNGEYGMLLDKKNQTLTIFHNGERIETLLVSTGRMEAGKYYQETSAGSFLTGLHRVDFSMQGSRYDFVIQYDGGNLLHQIPYTSDGRKDFTRGRNSLGSKASHACIRIQDTPGERSGINAYWIWTHIPYHTRLIILDDPEEREKTMQSLSGNN